MDGACATLDGLPAIRAAVGNRAEVYLDGGVRRSSDVFKGLAADAVLPGRATLYGLAAAGEAGADRAVAILKEEPARTMKLCGVTKAANLTATDYRLRNPEQFRRSSVARTTHKRNSHQSTLTAAG